MPLRDPQTWQFLRGDLEPRRIGWSDLRNDNAGDELTQAQSIILRYLESLPALEAAKLEDMVKDLSRHHPFHSKDVDFFEPALDALKDGGWVKVEDGGLKLDKVARVSARYLQSKISKTR